MHDEGSSSAFGILGAMMIFAASMSVAYAVTPSTTPAGLQGVAQQHEADMLAGLLLSPGPRMQPWTSAPDDLNTFTLVSADDPARVDLKGLALLAAGGIDARPNGAPDYADVKRALGLATDFHLSVHAIAPAISDAAWTPLPVRVAYFGHYSGARAAVASTTSLDVAADKINVSVSLTNRAMVPAIFTANVALGDATTGRPTISHDRHTTLLAPGETQEVWVRIPALASWNGKINAVRVSVTDPFGNPATDAAGNLVSTPWTPVTMPTAAPSPYALVLQAASPYYVAGMPVNFEVHAHDGRGGDVSDAAGRLVVTGPTGTERVNSTLSLDRGARTWTCANCTNVGNYTATVLDASGRLVALDRVHVSHARMFTDKRTPDPLAIAEIGMIDALVAAFDPTRFDPASGAGDVFRDDVNGPSELPRVLSRYDVVVVGSEASHHALAPADVKRAITTWVDAGGQLVVFGASQEPSRWLQSEYGLSLSHAVGVPVAPDARHPVLSRPEVLDHTRYLHRSRAWQLPPGAAFDHVLTLRPTPEGGALDTLALSTPGSFGNGTVTVTSYLPGALTSDAGDGEAKRFVHNLLVRGQGTPSVEFGPAIPDGVPVAAASRVALASSPERETPLVVRITLHVFR